jgi:hypothetical protein
MDACLFSAVHVPQCVVDQGSTINRHHSGEHHQYPPIDVLQGKNVI